MNEFSPDFSFAMKLFASDNVMPVRNDAEASLSFLHRPVRRETESGKDDKYGNASHSGVGSRTTVKMSKIFLLSSVLETIISPWSIP